VESRNFIKQSYNLSLFKLYLLSKLLDSCGKLYTGPYILIFFPSDPNLKFHFEIVDHFTKCCIFIKQVTIVAKHSLQFGLELLD